MFCLKIQFVKFLLIGVLKIDRASIVRQQLRTLCTLHIHFKLRNFETQNPGPPEPIGTFGLVSTNFWMIRKSYIYRGEGEQIIPQDNCLPTPDFSRIEGATLLLAPQFQVATCGLRPCTVLHRSICDVFWGLGDRSYTIMIQYGYQMKD